MDYVLYGIGVIVGFSLGIFVTLHVLSHEMGVDGCVDWNAKIMWCAKENPND